jgi:hypothetical protein
MMSARAGSGGEYLRFLASAVLVVCGAAAIGYLPTLRLGGSAAIPALVAGLVVAVAASAVGGVAIAMAGSEPIRRPQALLLATALRLFTAVGLALAAVASGRFAGRPLVVWTAIGYVALLVVDSRYAMRAPMVTPTAGRSDGGATVDRG